jgi:formylmethanofuran dehydrogenase subunit E
MFLSDDPALDAERYMADLDKKLARRPKCACCGEHIQDDTAVRYGDDLICHSCIADLTEFIEEEL